MPGIKIIEVLSMYQTARPWEDAATQALNRVPRLQRRVRNISGLEIISRQTAKDEGLGGISRDYLLDLQGCLSDRVHRSSFDGSTDVRIRSLADVIRRG